MVKYITTIVVYFFSLMACSYGLFALDFSRFIRKGKVVQAQVLFVVIALIMAYLLGNFLLAIMYNF